MPAGQNLEIMIFRYLKTLDFDKFFKESQHYVMFLLLSTIISDNYLLFMIVRLCPVIIHVILMKLCPS